MGKAQSVVDPAKIISRKVPHDSVGLKEMT